MSEDKPCPRCNAPAPFSPYCGVYVCSQCGYHLGLCRCYCGWSESGQDGRAELIEAGETIEPDDPSDLL